MKILIKIIKDIRRINWSSRLRWLKGRIYHAFWGSIIICFRPDIWCFADDIENLWCDIDPWGCSDEYEYLYFSGVPGNKTGAILYTAVCLFRKDRDFFDRIDSEITDYIEAIDNQYRLFKPTMDIQKRLRAFYGIKHEA